MQFKDLLRGTVLLIAVEGTGLAAISVLAVHNSGDEVLAAVAVGWWTVAIAIGLWLGGAERTAAAIAPALAAAKTSTSLPSTSPTRVAVARLWPVALFAVLVGALGLVLPQAPAIATGWALLIALSWRNREAAVTAIEERDGICFFVEPGPAYEAIKLVRTPGLKRDRFPSGHPPPPGSSF